MMPTFILRPVSITEDITISFGTLIFYGAHVFSDSPSDDVDEIVELNTPVMPSKLFEFSCAESHFVVILIDSSFSELPGFLTEIQQRVSSVSSFFLFGVCV